MWEAVRQSDTLGPPQGTYARVTDPRVRQFWDRDLLLSQRLIREILNNPKLLPDSEKVLEGTVIWDIAATFPPRVHWDHALPKPDYYGRPVVAVAGDLELALTRALSAKRP